MLISNFGAPNSPTPVSSAITQPSHEQITDAVFAAGDFTSLFAADEGDDDDIRLRWRRGLGRR